MWRWRECCRQQRIMPGPPKLSNIELCAASPPTPPCQPATQNTTGQMLHTRQYRLTLLLNKASAELLFIYKSIIYSIVTKYKRVERQVSLNDDTIFIITFVTNSMPLLLRIWTIWHRWRCDMLINAILYKMHNNSKRYSLLLLLICFQRWQISLIQQTFLLVLLLITRSNGWQDDYDNYKY